ncbi:MAG: S8 family serine peptidase [Streptosporangiales bacterium]|nr:S8 family serine peptidase [Streptosporangiales bacterium]
MSDPERPNRISRRHGAIVLDDEGHALAKKHELLCSRKHAATVVDDRLRKWVDSSEDVRGAGIVRIRLNKRARVDLRKVTADLEPYARVAPNLIYTGEPAWNGGPSGPPTQPSRKPRPPRAPSPGAKHATAAVLDTGISAHPWFTDRDWFADCGPANAEEYDADLDFELDSQAGHGTFVTGLLLHRAPDAHVTPVRVLSSDGVCDELELIKAIADLRPRKSGGIDVLNLSLGGYTHDDRPSPLLLEALHALGPKTVVVAAAGNQGTERPFWPAAANSVIAVGALEEAGGEPAHFSNHGFWVDACAPGQDVSSSFVWFNGPDVDTGAGDTDEDLFLGYADWSGTSFAAPQVAGAIAGICAKQGVDAPEAARILLDPSKHSYVPDLGLAVLEPRRTR